jgi:hypothetical protein
MITMFQGKIQGGGHDDDVMLQLAAKLAGYGKRASSHSVPRESGEFCTKRLRKCSRLHRLSTTHSLGPTVSPGATDLSLLDEISFGYNFFRYLYCIGDPWSA